MIALKEKFLNNLIQRNLVDDIDILKIRYTISSLKSEMIKTIFLISIFFLMGLTVPFLFTMIYIIPIRIFSGGFHFNNNIRCFLTSLVYFLLCVLFLPQVLHQSFVYRFLLFISAVLIIVLPIMPSDKRPIIRIDKYLLNKYVSMAFVLIYIFLFQFVLDNQYFISCGIWALFLHAIQLTTITIKNYMRRYRYAKKTI